LKIKFILPNQSSLLHAAMTGNVPIARLLVKLPGLDVNLADNEGNTALHLAAQAGITKSNQTLSIFVIG
jgi:ankyrin repeat protein